ncbi:MAG: endonuclease III [Anaerofustis sp.]
MDKHKADSIIALLEEEYGGTKCGLDFSTPYELLTATILSAQCTDVRVNIVTKQLFPIADTPQEMLAFGQQKLQDIIRPCGLSKTKSANIIKTAQMLLDHFNGEVPDDFDALTSLAGVGRKTANVVLSNAFGEDAIAVDTHVFRVSNRIGLAHANDVVKTEAMLRAIIDKDKWSNAHHWLIWHGRLVCSARKPKCSACVLRELCEYPNKTTDLPEIKS